MTNGSKLMDLLGELTKMAEVPWDPATMIKLQQDMRMNPLHTTVQAALIDHKANISITTNMIKDEVKENDEERLDNMLRAEGVIGSNPSLEHLNEGVLTENADYRHHLLKVRRQFEGDIRLCERHRANWDQNVRNALQAQGEFRPITQLAIDRVASIVSNKFNQVSVILKQKTCEDVIQLRKRYFDARRKRRNFSKTSTQILNDYFEANINHPYPSEEVKQALAVQCNISVAQVSNWFGNKRIRYKKTMSSERENRERAPPIVPTPYGFTPNPIMNQYHMMMQRPQLSMGVNPFNFYNPQMMAQWQQASVDNKPAQSNASTA